MPRPIASHLPLNTTRPSLVRIALPCETTNYRGGREYQSRTRPLWPQSSMPRWIHRLFCGARARNRSGFEHCEQMGRCSSAQNGQYRVTWRSQRCLVVARVGWMILTTPKAALLRRSSRPWSNRTLQSAAARGFPISWMSSPGDESGAVGPGSRSWVEPAILLARSQRGRSIVDEQRR